MDLPWREALVASFVRLLNTSLFPSPPLLHFIPVFYLFRVALVENLVRSNQRSLTMVGVLDTDISLMLYTYPPPPSNTLTVLGFHLNRFLPNWFQSPRSTRWQWSWENTRIGKAWTPVDCPCLRLFPSTSGLVQ